MKAEPTSLEFVSILMLIISLISALLWIFIKVALKQFTDKTEDIKSKVESLVKDFVAFKDSISTKQAELTKEFEEKLDKTDDELKELRIKVAQDSVTKKEFKEAVKELKGNIHELKDSIVEVDKITREQANLLTRIETSIQSMLE